MPRTELYLTCDVLRLQVECVRVTTGETPLSRCAMAVLTRTVRYSVLTSAHPSVVLETRRDIGPDCAETCALS
eukprot:2267454-Rhodomonas_salina.3